MFQDLFGLVLDKSVIFSMEVLLCPCDNSRKNYKTRINNVRFSRMRCAVKKHDLREMAYNARNDEKKTDAARVRGKENLEGKRNRRQRTVSSFFANALEIYSFNEVQCVVCSII